MKNEKDTEFLDEKGEKVSMHIESTDGRGVGISKLGKYKIANFNKKEDNSKKNIFTRDITFGKKKHEKGIFTRDIGVKSSGFAQVASLSMIVAVALIFVMYLIFKF